MTEHTFAMTESFAADIHAMAKDRIAALHNWIASAVESGDMVKAQGLVSDLRATQSIFAAFNVGAWHAIANVTGKPLVTEHSVTRR
jgi:hypothetical protein